MKTRKKDERRSWPLMFALASGVDGWSGMDLFANRAAPADAPGATRVVRSQPEKAGPGKRGTRRGLAAE